MSLKMADDTYSGPEGEEGARAISISPVQWSDLKDIDNVEPINSQDAECMQEIRDVLKKHGKLNRFGVALLHSHFKVEEDEILLESSDEEARTLVIQPVMRSEGMSNNIPTIWQLREEGVFASTWCQQYCKRPDFGHGPFGPSHSKAHAKRKN